MKLEKCKDCAWCCVFVGEPGRRARPRLTPEDKKRLAGRGRTWDEGGRLLTREDGTCVFYGPYRGCLLKPAERPFACLLYPFRRKGGGKYDVEPACPAVQDLLRRLTGENSGPLERDIAALEKKHAGTWRKSRRVKDRARVGPRSRKG